MTTRQFLSILLSCILFVHPLTFWQWIGTVTVFGTLYYKAFGKNHEHKVENKGKAEKLPDTNPIDDAAQEKSPMLPPPADYSKKDPFETA